MRWCSGHTTIHFKSTVVGSLRKGVCVGEGGVGGGGGHRRFSGLSG